MKIAQSSATLLRLSFWCLTLSAENKDDICSDNSGHKVFHPSVSPRAYLQENAAGFYVSTCVTAHVLTAEVLRGLIQLVAC